MNDFLFEIDISAKQEIIRQSNSRGNIGNFRIKLITGCAGFKYDFLWDDELKPTDNIINIGLIKLIVDPKSSKLLNNSKLYFDKSLMNSSFRLDNPQVSKTCGCGLSWS